MAEPGRLAAPSPAATRRVSSLNALHPRRDQPISAGSTSSRGPRFGRTVPGTVPRRAPGRRSRRAGHFREVEGPDRDDRAGPVGSPAADEAWPLADVQATSAAASQIQAARSIVSGFSARHPGQQPEPVTTQHDHNHRDGRAREQRLHQPSQHPAGQRGRHDSGHRHGACPRIGGISNGGNRNRPGEDKPGDVARMPVAGTRQQAAPALHGRRSWSDAGFGRLGHDFPGPTASMTRNRPGGEEGAGTPGRTARSACRAGDKVPAA